VPRKLHKQRGGIKAPHLLSADGTPSAPSRRVSRNDSACCTVLENDDKPLHNNPNPYVGWCAAAQTVKAANLVYQFKV
jgi:hypothetical protein